MTYADIVVDISHEKLDTVFQYAIPNELLEVAKVGRRVVIPFGKGNRFIKGYIVNLTDIPSYPVEKIKSISQVIADEVGLEGRMIQLAYFIKGKYGGTVNDALKTVIPVKKIIKQNQKRYIKLGVNKEELAKEIALCENNKTLTARHRLLSAFINDDIISEDLLVNKLNISKATIKSTVDKKLLTVVSEVDYRNPISCDDVKDRDIVLNSMQQAAVDRLISNYELKEKRNYLIHGVTGSGKTEVYMELIKYVVSKGQQVIVLIPEIALTYQTVRRFYAQFKDRVSVINSRLSQGERYDQYLRAKNGEIDIIIGPRSALFTPFDNLGLIVIDEEHEGSYISEMPPKYDAREVAMELARMTDSFVVLGSATPSVSTYYEAQNKRLELITLSERAANARMPKVYVQDLRQEMKNGNKTIFSEKLKCLINDRLSKNEQIMLFINRRGYSGFVSCRSCGHILKCPHCDVSLTYHSYSNSGKMVCHYCGYETRAKDSCPECSSKFISLFGTGTQKVELMTKNLFPNARILRMDADTTSGKNGHQEILQAFANHEADILIGTQMIVKGHDFSNVTLVGILAADLSLGSNDYNASEKTFQLLLQAAGRAGRGDKSGEVVIQTYKPDHYSIVSALNADYEGFYKQDMLFRRLAGYPPVENIMSILVMCKNEQLAETLIDNIKIFMDKTKEKSKEHFNVLGPTDARVSKINDVYRKVIYIKSADEKILFRIRNHLQRIINNTEEYKECTVHFDINPQHCN